MTKILEGKKILFSAGGTGGHVYPALALAKKLQQKGADIYWIGSENGIENKIVHFPLYKLKISGLRGKGIKKIITSPLLILKAIITSKKIIKDISPDLYIGFGGFATGPGGIAAVLLRIPIIIHEQNSVMGFTNRILRHFAKRLLLAFPVKQRDGIVLGNPVRPEISEIKVKSNINNPIHLLVIGGSQGALVINKIVPNALNKINGPLIVTHQTGEFSYKDTVDAYSTLDIKANITPYINDMAKAYQESDLIIARAGALSVSEICSAGRAAIFIPLPSAVDNHQFLNAKYSKDNNAAVILEQKDLTPESLSGVINQLIQKQKIIDMSISAKSLSHEDALKKMAQQVIEVVND